MFGTSLQVKAVDSTGSWTAVASSPAVDRDTERIVARALHWKTEKLPTHAGHNFKIESLVGRVRPYYDPGGLLLVDGKWGSSDLAQHTRRLVMDGVLDSMSIVFTGAQKSRSEKDGVTEITAGELVAVDWVSIPSNHEARVLAARAWQDRDGLLHEARLAAIQAQMDLARLTLADTAHQTREAVTVDPAGLRKELAELQAFLTALSTPAHPGGKR